MQNYFAILDSMPCFSELTTHLMLYIHKHPFRHNKTTTELFRCIYCVVYSYKFKSMLIFILAFAITVVASTIVES